MELICGGHVIHVIARDLPENPIGDITRNRYKIGVYPDFVPVSPEIPFARWLAEDFRVNHVR